MALNTGIIKPIDQSSNRAAVVSGPNLRGEASREWQSSLSSIIGHGASHVADFSNRGHSADTQAYWVNEAVQESIDRAAASLSDYNREYPAGAGMTKQEWLQNGVPGGWIDTVMRAAIDGLRSDQAMMALPEDLLPVAHAIQGALAISSAAPPEPWKMSANDYLR